MQPVQYTVFPNAPIVEAILDINAKMPKGVTPEALNKFYDKVKTRFPEKKERRFFKGGIELGSESSTFASQSGTDGFLFESQIDKKIVQARLDGFTFNKLRPYENWKCFREEAYELWNLYCDIAEVKKVTRIALRYINRIEVPLPLGDFKDYLLITPEVTPQLPQELAHFLLRLVIPNDDIGATATIIETMGQKTPDNKLPLILDIDVWQLKEYESDYRQMWKDFEKLRVFKNDIFFNSTTDRAKELFK
jgi:uncharacterized protein (TIGR04255 family)